MPIFPSRRWKPPQVLLNELCTQLDYKCTYIDLRPYGHLQELMQAGSVAEQQANAWYKTSRCTMQEALVFNEGCPNGQLCPFAHNEEELRPQTEEKSPMQSRYELQLFSNDVQFMRIQNSESKASKGDAKSELARLCLENLGFKIVHKFYLHKSTKEESPPRGLLLPPIQMLLNNFCHLKGWKLVYEDLYDVVHLSSLSESERLGKWYKSKLLHKLCCDAVEGECPRGSACSFAHSPAELLEEPIDLRYGFDLHLLREDIPTLTFRSSEGPFPSPSLAKAAVAGLCAKHLGLCIGWCSELRPESDERLQELVADPQKHAEAMQSIRAASAAASANPALQAGSEPPPSAPPAPAQPSLSKTRLRKLLALCHGIAKSAACRTAADEGQWLSRLGGILANVCPESSRLVRAHFGSLRAFVRSNPGQFPDLPEQWADSKWAGTAHAAALEAPAAPDPGVAPTHAGRWAEDERIGPADVLPPRPAAPAAAPLQLEVGSVATPPAPCEERGSAAFWEATPEAKADPAADSINADAQWPKPAPLVGSSASPGSSAGGGGGEVVRAELHAHLER